MAIRVRREHLLPSGGRDPLALILMFQVVRDLLHQLIEVTIRDEVLAVAEQLRLAVVAELVGHQERSAGQGLEHPHVDIAQHAAVEDDPRGGVGLGHLVEIAPADEHVGEVFLEMLDGLGAPAGQKVPDEADVVPLRHVVLAVDFGIAGKRQPLRRGNPLAVQPLCPVALRGQHEVEVLGLGAVPLEIQVGVDRPERAGAQVAGKPVPQTVVDVQVQVEAAAGDVRQIAGQEVLDLNELLQCPLAVRARRVLAHRVVEDQGDASDGHAVFLQASVCWSGPPALAQPALEHRAVVAIDDHVPAELLVEPLAAGLAHAPAQLWVGQQGLDLP